MKPALFHWPMIALQTALLVGHTDLFGQESAASSKLDTIVVRPFNPQEAEPPRLGDSRRKLVEAIGELVSQEDVKRQLLKETRAGFDGTARTALKVHLVEQMMLEDQSRMLPLVSRAGERLRWDIERDMKHKAQMAAERTEAVRRVETEIERLADEVLSLDERPDGDVSLALRRQLVQRRLKRDETAAKAREYADSAQSREKELADIRRLKKWIAASRAEAAIRNERLRDAVEHEHTTLLAEQIDAGRQSLRDTLAILRSRAEETEKAIHNCPAISRTAATAWDSRCAKLADFRQPMLQE